MQLSLQVNNISDSLLSKISYRFEIFRIRCHLCGVEMFLRTRDISHLSEELQVKRKKHIAHLREYWKAGVFPKNLDFSKRTPYFKDAFDIPCAVAYLMERDGYSNLVNNTASTNNHIYVDDIKEGPALDWINNSGLTQKEAALIQPTYGHHLMYPTELLLSPPPFADWLGAPIGIVAAVYAIYLLLFNRLTNEVVAKKVANTSSLGQERHIAVFALLVALFTLMYTNVDLLEDLVLVGGSLHMQQILIGGILSTLIFVFAYTGHRWAMTLLLFVFSSITMFVYFAPLVLPLQLTNESTSVVFFAFLSFFILLFYRFMVIEAAKKNKKRIKIKVIGIIIATLLVSGILSLFLSAPLIPIG